MAGLIYTVYRVLVLRLVLDLVFIGYESAYTTFTVIATFLRYAGDEMTVFAQYLFVIDIMLIVHAA